MRMAGTVTVLLAVLAVIALCPAFACFASAAAHPCCPPHKAPVTSQVCPLIVLEAAKAAPVLSAAIVTLSPAGLAAPRIAVAWLPEAAPTAAPQELVLLLRTLRI